MVIDIANIELGISVSQIGIGTIDAGSISVLPLIRMLVFQEIIFVDPYSENAVGIEEKTNLMLHRQLSLIQ